MAISTTLSTGPDMSKTWKIIDAKTEGATPGFTIRDGRGDMYLIKLDPYYWRQMATSTEVIGRAAEIVVYGTAVKLADAQDSQ